MLCPDEEGSVGKTADFEACNSWKTKSSVDEVPYHRSNRPSHTSCDLCSPTLSEEDLEAVRTALWYGQLQTVVPHTPNNG